MQNTILVDIPDPIKDFLALPEGLYKDIVYSKGLNPFEYTTVAKDGDNIYFSRYMMRVNKSAKSYYIKRTSKQGLSWKESKFNIWFGGNIEQFTPCFNHIFTYMNWNFTDPALYGYITKGILTNLFKGKITNNKDLLKYYCKSVRINCSYDLLQKAICTSGHQSLDKMNFYRYAIVAKNVDHFLERFLAEKNILRNTNITDLVAQYLILKKKIDFKWSDKRIAEEHKAATKIIMDEELLHLEDIEVEYPTLSFPEEAKFIPLDSLKKIYNEGSTMGHCLYTNYWGNIKSMSYLAYHIIAGNEEATLGCSFYSGKISLNQCYGRHNTEVSDKMKNIYEKFLECNKDKIIASKQTTDALCDVLF